jgi:parallel beta-helix repeat protein
VEGKFLLLLVIVALLTAFQESSKLAAPKIRGTIHIDQEITFRSTPPGVHSPSPLNFARRNLVPLKTDCRPINHLKLVDPQQEEPLIDHAPISINNNVDFVNQGFPGAGTLLDPYRIEGFNITASGTTIAISDTTAYFRISGNYMNCLGETHSEGIRISNVIHGTIINNVVVNNLMGISVTNSGDCNITNNYVYESGNEGIWILSSENNTISHNAINETGVAILVPYRINQ